MRTPCPDNSNRKYHAYAEKIYLRPLHFINVAAVIRNVCRIQHLLQVKYWGFEISPKTVSDVWTIEAHISFEPTGEPVTVSLTTPGNSNAFKILEEDVVAPGYKVKKVNNETSRMILTAPAQTTPQDIYYRVMLFDNIDTRGKIKAPQPAAPKMPIMDEQTLTVAQQIIKLADQSQQGDDVSKIIRFINQVPADPTVQSYPVSYTHLTLPTIA